MRALIIRIFRFSRTETATHRKLDRGDVLWLRWVLLSLCVLIAQTVLLATGCFEPLNTAHTAMLQGAPFHLSADGAAQGDVLSPAIGFACSIGLTLYWAAVQMYQKSFGSRCLLTALALVAVALPGMLSVLWDRVLYVVPLLFCVSAVWLAVVCIPFFRIPRS
ncbi:MAG: hypothetical protein Q4A24_01940 [Akkermansia sp.]|nr:hypothetical protein [Akkermansia sp.]